MGCNCGGGSTQAWSPGGRSDAEDISPIGVEGTPVHLRPGRQGVPVPDWLPRPAGEPAVPTHERG